MPLSFKDFMTVDYTQDGDEQSAHNAKKRKRGHHDTSGTVSASKIKREANEEQQDEALSHAQRIKASLRMKKMKARIKIGRDRAMRKSPNMDVVKKRALKKARLLLLKKMTKGVGKDEMSFARRAEIEKRLAKKKNVIQRLAKKMIPDVRKADRERRANKGK
jgi:hypothetical protein